MTNKKWFCTPDAETKKGISGYRFYLALKKDYVSDVELSPSPWVHAEALETEKNFFFTSRDIAYPEITKRLGEVEKALMLPCYVCNITFDDKLLYPVVDDNDEKTGEYICHECLNNNEEEEELFPYHPETVEEGLRFCLAWELKEDYPNGFPQAYPVSFGKKELIFFPNRCGNCENNYTNQRNCPKFS